MRGNLREYGTFLRRAVREPATIGAVLPTSRHVAAAMTGVLPTTGTPTVVELGPGTGVLSAAARDRLPPRARQIAVELDPEMVDYLRTSQPWLRVLHGDATHLRDLLEAEGITRADAVISSIPWTLLPAERQRQALNEVACLLQPDGVFTAITYLTTLWRTNTAAFLRSVHACFDEVLPRSTVWRNVPPARIYVCRRPKHGPGADQPG